MQRTGQDPLHHLLSESRRTMQDGSKEQRGIPCEQPTGTKRIPAFSSVGRAAYVTGRRIVPVVVWGAVRSQAAVLQNSKRSGTAEISVQMHCSKLSSSMDGCFLHSIFWRGRLFSTPAPPFRLWFCKAAAVSRTRCRLKERKEVQEK